MLVWLFPQDKFLCVRLLHQSISILLRFWYTLLPTLHKMYTNVHTSSYITPRFSYCPRPCSRLHPVSWWAMRTLRRKRFYRCEMRLLHRDAQWAEQWYQSGESIRDRKCSKRGGSGVWDYHFISWNLRTALCIREHQGWDPPQGPGSDGYLCHLQVVRPLGKSFNLSEPQFLQLSNKENTSTFLIDLLKGSGSQSGAPNQQHELTSRWHILCCA